MDQLCASTTHRGARASLSVCSAKIGGWSRASLRVPPDLLRQHAPSRRSFLSSAPLCPAAVHRVQVRPAGWQNSTSRRRTELILDRARPPTTRATRWQRFQVNPKFHPDRPQAHPLCLSPRSTSGRRRSGSTTCTRRPLSGQQPREHLGRGCCSESAACRAIGSLAHSRTCGPLCSWLSQPLRVLLVGEALAIARPRARWFAVMICEGAGADGSRFELG